VDVEGHGREPLTAGLDLSRTVGWLTSVHPVRLDPGPEEAAGIRAGGPAAGRVVKQVKEQLRAVPGDGLGYGLLRYLNPATAGLLAALTSPQIGFNYLGRTATVAAPADDTPSLPAAWRLMELGGDAGAGLVVRHPVQAGAVVRDAPDGPVLSLSVAWPGDLLDENSARELATGWRDMLLGLAEHAAHPGAGGHTPSDFPLLALAQDQVDEFEALAAEMDKGTPA
jgi:non-ribosomal peptide synthase protein (TIGR01720 family)